MKVKNNTRGLAEQESSVLVNKAWELHLGVVSDESAK